MKLSIVFGGRDDNYGENFIQRMKQALESNIENLKSFKYPYEIIVVDFNPISKEKRLINNSELSALLTNKNVKNVIVDRSVLEKENLPSSRYYEYFAKNAGIRRSSGEFIFVTNSDIIISKSLLEEIEKELSNEAKDNHFYRVRYRRSIDLGKSINDWYIQPTCFEDLNIPNLPDSCISGYCSGDASMFSKKVMFEYASGYDEGEMGHRGNFRQSAMDAEILWNLYHKGIRLKFLEAPYYHIEHERPKDRDGVYNNRTYRNNDNWGFAQYKETIISENTTLVGMNDE